MRRWIVILLSLSFSLLLFGKEQSLDELIQRAQSARPQDQPGLYIDIAERELKNADKAYVVGKSDEAKDAIRNMLAHADKAHDASRDTGKKQKNIEIALRKMAAKLRDVKGTQSVDEEETLQKAADHLEELRTDLLSHMFGKDAR